MDKSPSTLIGATTKVVAFSLCDAVTRRIGPERTLALGGKIADALPGGEWSVTIARRNAPVKKC